MNLILTTILKNYIRKDFKDLNREIKFHGMLLKPLPLQVFYPMIIK